MFGQQSPLGKRVYDNIGQAATIIGVVDPVMGSWPMNEHPDWVFFAPRVASTLYGGAVNYLVRTQPGQRDTAMRLVEAHLTKINPNRVINFVRPLTYFKDLTDLGDRSMGIYLLTVTGLLIAVTCLGIFALATFNVATRTKQIGTRRAVGARRRDIVRYFLVENGLDHERRNHRRLPAGARDRLLALRAVRPAAPEPLLPGGRRAGAVGHRAVRGVAAGAARGGGVALGRHPHRVARRRLLGRHGGRQCWC